MNTNYPEPSIPSISNHFLSDPFLNLSALAGPVNREPVTSNVRAGGSLNSSMPCHPYSRHHGQTSL